ncbi:unnamed protein product [Rhizoctonia solani]|uniref:Zn(2)-C6 fungal-type domain-containing protein n=1 Tax=Rhizoctonia solani TaxID=456999 RepID=A0A8H2WJI1_9AGAM|nr:unnamed protein product [Rhizoctonia solani]
MCSHFTRLFHSNCAATRIHKNHNNWCCVAITGVNLPSRTFKAYHMDHRSSFICGNCIKRHLTCDGAQPVCNTCIREGQLCAGYGTPDCRPQPFSTFDTLSPGSEKWTQDPLSRVVSVIISTPVWASRAPDCFSTYPAHRISKRTSDDQLGIVPTYSIIPKSVPSDPYAVGNALPFVHYQYNRLIQLMAFDGPSAAFLAGFVERMSISAITFSLMTLGAKIIQSVFDAMGSTGWKSSYETPINKLHWQACNTPDEGSSLICTQGRLVAAIELTAYKFFISNNASGYAFLKMTTPLVTRVACHYPQIWTQQGRISTQRLLSLGSMELCSFVWMDAMSSTLFGTTPLLCYDPCIQENSYSRHPMEWMHGCPQVFVGWFVKLSVARSDTKQRGSTSPQIDWKIAEKEIQGWEPIINKTNLSKDSITRLAVVEGWRHALLIHLYMGAYGVTSMDPRVQSSVKQIVRLSQVAKDQTTYERHLFAPAILAGASARLESHRRAILQTIALGRHDRMWVLKISEFVFVLKHLWHGAASGGRPIAWDDYVRSRKAVLHINE